jgi:hypothetical protein
MSDRWIRFIGMVLSIWTLYFIRTRYGYKPALLAFTLECIGMFVTWSIYRAGGR